MIEYAYYNGVFTPYNATCIPLTDRSVFFSDAVYDVVIGSRKKPYQLDEHLNRLFGNAHRIDIKKLPSKSHVEETITALLGEADADDFLLYIQLSTNSMQRSHAREDGEPNLLITVTKCDLPKELGSIRAITLPDIRHGYCNVKTTNLLPAVLSIEEARRHNADIAIFHKNRAVTECSHANISIIKDGKLVTHPLDSDILPGITQINLERAAKNLGIAHESRVFSIDELYEAEAVMITSTTKLIKVCTAIDSIPLNVSAIHTVEQLFEALKSDLYSEVRQNTLF